MSTRDTARGHRAADSQPLAVGPYAGLEGLRTLDVEFAAFVTRLAGRQSEELTQAAALVSHAAGRGHVCLDLAAPELALPDYNAVPNAALPEPARWGRALSGLSVVGSPGDRAPLILDGTRLYLHRYWADERFLASSILERAGRRMAGVDMRELRRLLDRYYPDTERDRWQRVAVATAALSGLTVITGGPGTGKTTTMATIAAVLVQLDPRLRVALAAPTGKAAARMLQALGQAAAERFGALPGLPQEATTIHRLLGARPHGGGYGRGPDNPLGLDVLIVDEASMVDLPLMARLFEALPADCRVVIVGDRSQLASVEAGAVLGDLCNPDAVGRYSVPAARMLAVDLATELPDSMVVGSRAGLGDSLVELTHVYRFQQSLEAISQAVRAARPEDALSLMRSSPDVVWKDLPRSPSHLTALIEEEVLTGYRAYVEARDPRAKLDALAGFRILCALRQGPYGVDAANAVVERILTRHGLIRLDSPFYADRPLLVTRNEYALELYNGDIGFVLGSPEHGGAAQAVFPARDGGFRILSPHRLSAVETAFALTVHKSQGSEFASILLLLPDRDAPVLTRELVYTGLTRARTRAVVLGDRSVFCTAVSRGTRRASGLSDRLWGL